MKKFQLSKEQESQIKELKSLHSRLEYFLDKIDDADTNECVNTEIEMMEWSIRVHTINIKELI